MKDKFILILIVSIFFSCQNSDEKVITELEKNFNVDQGFKEDYRIEDIEDFSFENSVGKNINIIVPPDLKKERIEDNIQKLVLDYLKENGQTKLHIKVFMDGDSISKFPDVASAEFLPYQKGWDADDNEYGLETYILEISYWEDYIAPNLVKEPTIDKRGIEIYKDTQWDKNKREFVKANSVPISNSIKEWTSDKIIVEIPNNSPAKIIDEYTETLVDGSEFKRYKIEVQYQGKTYKGWIHSEEVK